MAHVVFDRKYTAIKNTMPNILSTRFIASFAATCLLSGCASTWHPKTPEDPYESYNRAIFAFNLKVDRYVYRPLAKSYDFITPNFAQDRVRNFFSNVAQVPIIANDLMQFNMPWMFSDVGRLLVNSTLGLGGLFDPATPIGMKKHSQDFGLTMAVWGVRESPYLLLPLLPPTTARDFLSFPVDGYALSIWTYMNPDWIRYAARGTDFIQMRAKLLSSDKAVDQAFDPYLFVRDYYLQNRKAKIQRVLHPNENEGVPLQPTPIETTKSVAITQTEAAG